jgi:hypothetical protein
MSNRARVLLLVGALVAVFVTTVIVWSIVEDDEPDEEGVTAVIDNRVTNGPTMMREDDAPVCLTETPRNFCQDVVVTDLWSGDEIELLCQTTSERTTNGNDGETNDNNNPGLFTSDPGLWYWARYADDEGYISEVWLESDARGGLGLRVCDR